MIDSERLAEARANLEKAMQEFTQAYHDEYTTEDEESFGQSVFMSGWVGYAEYVTSNYVQNDKSASCVAVPEAQHFSMSRGLFENGTDRFRR